MFKHLFSYSLKTFFRNKEGVAFGLFFPLAFSLIYLFVFSGLLNNATNLETIPVAIVFDGSTSEVDSARDMLQTIASPAQIVDGELLALESSAAVDGGDNSHNNDSDKQDQPIMHYLEVSADEAADLVADAVVSAVIYVDNSDRQLAISLEVAPGAINHFSSSVLYSALSSFTSINLGVQTAFESLAESEQPAISLLALNQNLSELSQTQAVTIDANVEKGTSTISLYFYACLAYLCIFFMSIGTNIITLNEANYSSQALRATVSPINKLKHFFAVFLSFSLPCFAIIYTILIIYYQNNVPLGNEWGRIILLVSLGLLVGLLMGTALASVTKASPGLLNAFYVGVPLTLAAFSGLMAQDLKFIIDDRFPLINQLNPVSLINDSLIALNNYPTYRQYNQNMMTLLLIALILLALTLYSLRRSDYENL